jgi:hypothetical protein
MIIFKKNEVESKCMESKVEYCEVAVCGEKYGNWIWTETGK